MADDLLTTAQVAVRLGVTTSTVNRMASDGRLSVALTLPGETGARLYHRADIDALVDAS